MKKKLAGFRPVIPSRGRYASLRLQGVRLARRTAQSAWRFTAGGSWTQQLRPSIRHNLRSFWFDGLFAASSNEILLAITPEDLARATPRSTKSS